MKPCGHVVCKTCTDTLVKPALQCIVCDKQLKAEDVIELQREGTRVVRQGGLLSSYILILGTGFAGGGLAETSKAGIAFQG